MLELSEFVEFVDEKASVKKPSLVEKDILIHGILNEIVSSELGKLYLFKGGSYLVKCYFGYYRFSVDLDFTWREQSFWNKLGKKSLRRKLLEQTERFEREMFVVAPPAEFYRFMGEFEKALKEIGLAAMQYRSKGGAYYKLRKKLKLINQIS